VFERYWPLCDHEQNRIGVPSASGFGVLLTKTADSKYFVGRQDVSVKTGSRYVHSRARSAVKAHHVIILHLGNIQFFWGSREHLVRVLFFRFIESHPAVWRPSRGLLGNDSGARCARFTTSHTVDMVSALSCGCSHADATLAVCQIYLCAVFAEGSDPLEGLWRFWYSTTMHFDFKMNCDGTGWCVTPTAAAQRRLSAQVLCFLKYLEGVWENEDGALVRKLRAALGDTMSQIELASLRRDRYLPMVLASKIQWRGIQMVMRSHYRKIGRLALYAPLLTDSSRSASNFFSSHYCPCWGLYPSLRAHQTFRFIMARSSTTKVDN